MLEIANGIEGGIKYRAFYDEKEWHVVVGDKTETWKGFAPRCGPDVSDVAKAEEIMDRLLSSAKAAIKRPVSDHIGDADEMVTKRLSVDK